MSLSATWEQPVCGSHEDICFSADSTAAKWKRQPVRRRDVMTPPWCSLNQRNNNMLSASAKTFDSHSTRAASPLGRQETSPSSPGWHWACQTFHSTSVFSETIHISRRRATRQLLLDISIICTRFDLTKAIRCQWHLASAGGDRQVSEASRQHTGPGGIAKVGAV